MITSHGFRVMAGAPFSGAEHGLAFPVVLGLNMQTRKISPEETVADLREALDGWFAEPGVPDELTITAVWQLIGSKP